MVLPAFLFFLRNSISFGVNFLLLARSHAKPEVFAVIRAAILCTDFTELLSVALPQIQPTPVTKFNLNRQKLYVAT